MASALWLKDKSGTWVSGAKQSTRSSTGWKYASAIYEKTGTSTWTRRWLRDVTAPAPPTATLTTDAVAKTGKITLKMPSDPDVALFVLKGGHTTYPKTPSLTNLPADEYVYLWNDAINGQVWSTMKVSPGQTVERNLKNYVSGRTYYYACWVQDTSGNWSAPRTFSVKFPQPPAPPPPPAPVTKTYTTNCTGSGSWVTNWPYWRSDNNYVYQAGNDSYGAWFYSGRLESALKNAKTIKKITIRVTRVNSAHGISGAANVYLSAHRYQTRPSGKPSFVHSPGVYVGTLSRGQTKTFTVPSSWYASIKSGAYDGFGLRYGSSSFTSANYLYCYGSGTTSGQVYMEWTQ